jgi:molybdopterin/thiamine biosynthesis adenylyltransferase
MSSTTYLQRDLRQRDIVPPLKLAGCRAIVIGVGAIGRQVAMQLAAVGVGAMDLIDFDIVAEANLAPQAYWPEDLGQLKVEATGRLCRSINPAMDIAIHAQRFRRSLVRDMAAFADSGRRAVVFACVDSISTRRLIWEAVRSRAALFIDGRMSAEVMRALALEHPATDDYYASTLFGEEQVQGDSCTARSTVYTASIAAGLMLGQFIKWLRGIAVKRDVTLNLPAGELSLR